MENIEIDGYVGMSLLFTKFKTKKFINTADFNINKVPGVPGYDREKDTKVIRFNIKLIGLHVENKELVIRNSGVIEGGENIFVTLEVKAEIPLFIADKTGTLYFTGVHKNVKDTIKVSLTKSELSELVRGVIRPYVTYTEIYGFSVKMIPNVTVMA